MPRERVSIFSLAHAFQAWVRETKTKPFSPLQRALPSALAKSNRGYQEPTIVTAHTAKAIDRQKPLKGPDDIFGWGREPAPEGVRYANDDRTREGVATQKLSSPQKTDPRREVQYVELKARPFATFNLGLRRSSICGRQDC